MTVDYKPLANDGAANVVSQAAFLVLLAGGGALEHGFQAGTAQSDQMNKVWRQSSMMSAALANVIANILGIDVLDDGNLANLIANLQAAITASAFTTGDMKPTVKTAADAGWIMMNDGTIGSAASTADYANNNAEALFTLLWNNTANADCPVIPAKGGSAATDWAANKKITLPQVRGRALAGAGAGAGLTPRALGSTVGSENLQEHHHDINTIANCQGLSAIGLAGGGVDSRIFLNNGAPASETGDTGTGNAGNMEPTTFVNWMIKL